jgi:2-polyprenyl-6-methoxyphenol hydroxylase-like FAD-dependent oxidoreductase
MAARSIAVLGGGVAGMASALLLARDGHRVLLLEQDDVSVSQSGDSPGWERTGVPHFLQPHAMIPRGCLELARHFPDVLQSLLDNGANEIDVRPKIAGPAKPGDEELRYLGVRRPVLEWALRRAVLNEPGVEVRRELIEGLEHGTDVVVDALGKRSPVGGWVNRPAPESKECGVAYYSRYYRVRPGCSLPDGPWGLGPRGDLGYLGFGTFPGDNGTFATLLSVPSGRPEWKVLRDAPAFEAAVARIPMARIWSDPDLAEPLTGVLPMAGLRNSLQVGPESPGVFTVGDALSHTDPTLAHGLVFGLIHAHELTVALREHTEVADAQAAFTAATAPAQRERYELASAMGEQRRRMWVGEDVDLSRHDGDYALFSFVAAGAVGQVEPDVLRMFLRRIGLLDSTSVLDDDLALRVHIQDVFRSMMATPRPPSGPSREEMLAIIEAAT